MTLFHSPSVQAPAAWDKVNLTQAGMRTRLLDSGYRYKVHPDETTAGVTARVVFGFDPGDLRRYGGNPDNATNNDQPIADAVAVCTTGSFLPLQIHGGIYAHASTANFSFSNLRILCFGKAQFRMTGAGIGCKIDGGVGALFNVQMVGYLEELGGATCTVGWFIQAVGRSTLNVRAKNATSIGIQILFAVLCEITAGMTNNDGVIYTTPPPFGLVLNQRGAGEPVSFCVLRNCFVENLGLAGVGIDVASGFGNLFIGGSAEGNGTNLFVNGATNHKNTFQNMDFEAGAITPNNDIVVSGGTNTKFINCNSQSASTNPTCDLSGGDSTSFHGGFYRQINVQNGATGTVIEACQVSDALNITGTGAKRVFGVQRVDGTLTPTANLQHDEIGTFGSFPVAPTITGAGTAGAQTYSTQIGRFRRVAHGYYVSINLTLTANAGGAGNATISNLPFAADGVNQTFSIDDYTGITLPANTIGLFLRVPPGGTTGILIAQTAPPAGGVNTETILAITAIGAAANLVINGYLAVP